MPLPINRVPPGLLSLLDTKSGGVNPLQLSDSLVGQIELTNFYFAGISSRASGDSVAHNSIGQLAPMGTGDNLRCPAGFIYVAPYACVRSTTALAGANGRIRAALCLYNTTLGTVVWSEATQEFEDGELLCCSTNRPLVYGPGLGLGIHFSRFDAEPLIFRFETSLAKLRF